jgi:hypothetical protein
MIRGGASARLPVSRRAGGRSPRRPPLQAECQTPGPLNNCLKSKTLGKSNRHDPSAAPADRVRCLPNRHNTPTGGPGRLPDWHRRAAGRAGRKRRVDIAARGAENRVGRSEPDDEAGRTTRSQTPGATRPGRPPGRRFPEKTANRTTRRGVRQKTSRYSGRGGWPRGAIQAGRSRRMGPPNRRPPPASRGSGPL